MTTEQLRTALLNALSTFQKYIVWHLLSTQEQDAVLASIRFWGADDGIQLAKLLTMLPTPEK